MTCIRKIETFTVPPRWILVRIETDDGAVGWGESIVPKRQAGVLGTINDIAQNIIGKNAFQIEDIAQSIRKGSFFRDGPVVSAALAGIEIALWDLKGKSVGLPVYEFLGGAVRNKIRSYAWVNGETTSDLVEHAHARQKQGFNAIKLTPHGSIPPIGATAEIDDLVQRLGALRDTFGKTIDIAVDLHGRVSRTVLKSLIKEIEPFSPMWIEEPTTPENEDALLNLAQNCPNIPIATGERLITPWQFKRLLDTGAVDIIQPDVSLTGLFALEKIARLAELYDVLVAPHSPNGPMCLAASLQIGFCCSNVVLQETSWGLDYQQSHKITNKGEMSDYVADASALKPQEGWLYRNDTPGLGLEFDEAAIRSAHSDWVIKDSDWRHPDGSFAEW